MPLISSTNLLRGLSAFHLTVAYLLLAAPEKLANQNLVVILGQAVRLPQVMTVLSPEFAHPASASFSAGTPALGLAATFLSFLALSDLAALSMQDEVHNAYWTAQIPARLAALFAFEAWIYLTKPGPGDAARGIFMGLKNDVVFTWAFVELVNLFWVYLTLRDERKDMKAEQARKMKAEQE